MSRSRDAGPATVLAGIAGIVLALPLWYALSGSLMTPEEIRALPPVLVPASPVWTNYAVGWNGVGLGSLLITSTLLAVLTAAFQVLTGAAAAFALARLRFPGRRTAVRAVIVLAAIPSLVLLVPRFVMIDAWGWAGGFAGLAAPALVSAGAILFLYQVFRMLPREPEEAARLDGAGPWTVFARVVVPQAQPALVVVAGFAVLAQWRSLLWPLVIAKRSGPQVAEVGLASRLIEGPVTLSPPALLAVGVLIALPALVTAAGVALSRARAARAARALEGELPAEVSPLTPGPVEHHVL